jgi:hypothetical protein
MYTSQIIQTSNLRPHLARPLLLCVFIKDKVHMPYSDEYKTYTTRLLLIQYSSPRRPPVIHEYYRNEFEGMASGWASTSCRSARCLFLCAKQIVSPSNEQQESRHNVLERALIFLRFLRSLRDRFFFHFCQCRSG